MTEHVVLPPHGFVRLVKWMGSELDIVNAARVSFHKESEWGEHPPYNDQPPALKDEDAKLIRYLLKNKHGTPFEQGFQSMWHVRLPIFVMREWVRHRIGHSVNEESGRYVKMRPNFYYPEYVRTQVGKPGAYHYEETDPYTKQQVLNHVVDNGRSAWKHYTDMLEMGVAKEQARIVLPLNLYTEIRWTANARSLMNFLSLRNSEHAMHEIKLYAEEMEEEFERAMPTVHEAFVEAGRVSP